MHAHSHEHEDTEMGRPEASRQPEEMSHMVRAAVAGRPDVLGTSGVGTLQRAVGNGAMGRVLQRQGADGHGGTENAEEEESRSSVHQVVASGGEPLDTETRVDMEARLGADFSGVRIHTGSEAGDSAKKLGARAYTAGDHVVFQRDAYEPSTEAGRTLIAHELTHVIQQRSGPVDGTETADGVRVSDPSDRFEREAAANAERVMAEPAPAPAAPAAATAAAPSAAVQRMTEDGEGEDEEPADVQGSFVQRAEEGEEEAEETSG